VAIPDRHAAILLRLLAQAGKVISKEALIDAGWREVAVGDNSLEQAISSLRRVLGPALDGAPYIETLARRGYRFRAPVARVASRIEDAALDALLAPHRAFIEGRTALESFDRSAINRARTVFEGIVEGSPDYAPGHIGLANAYSLTFESTRADDAPDRDALAKAVRHAREACSLDPSSGEAWATLGAVLSQARLVAEGIAAARRSISLENENWRHHLRLAYVSWGEERLRAANRALRLMPGFAFAHWLSATVHVARGALDEAEKDLVAGTRAQDRQGDGARFGASGLHFLLGLVRLTRGDEREALEEFDRELAREHAPHIYTREVCAHTWCAVAAVRLRQGERAAAMAAFDRAVASVPGYPLALAGVLASNDGPCPAERLALNDRLDQLRAQGALVEAAMLEAVGEALQGRHVDAAAIVRTALEGAPAAASGWMIPVEPFLHVSAHQGEWGSVLAMLGSRAA
jgi:DNA-binding winged helix-turn-helix (wHTH) protein